MHMGINGKGCLPKRNRTHHVRRFPSYTWQGNEFGLGSGNIPVKPFNQPLGHAYQMVRFGVRVGTGAYVREDLAGCGCSHGRWRRISVKECWCDSIHPHISTLG